MAIFGRARALECGYCDTSDARDQARRQGLAASGHGRNMAGEMAGDSIERSPRRSNKMPPSKAHFLVDTERVQDMPSACIGPFLGRRERRSAALSWHAARSGYLGVMHKGIVVSDLRPTIDHVPRKRRLRFSGTENCRGVTAGRHAAALDARMLRSCAGVRRLPPQCSRMMAQRGAHTYCTCRADTRTRGTCAWETCRG